MSYVNHRWAAINRESAQASTAGRSLVPTAPVRTVRPDHSLSVKKTILVLMGLALVAYVVMPGPIAVRPAQPDDGPRKDGGEGGEGGDGEVVVESRPEAESESRPEAESEAESEVDAGDESESEPDDDESTDDAVADDAVAVGAGGAAKIGTTARKELA